MRVGIGEDVRVGMGREDVKGGHVGGVDMWRGGEEGEEGGGRSSEEVSGCEDVMSGRVRYMAWR